MNAEAKFVSSVMDARLKKAKRERDAYKKQRDEIINDMAETKKKAEAFDEILEITEEDCWAEDFAVYISQVIDKYKEVDHEG
ncbi:hypothetical protein H6L69_07865 [Staphylococcus epidermidis]|jgi:hypothetical protein|uniref:hypothetical protein n=1 Tax=Staphylococcus epidermidis TaxID=1282 RepID=UPI000CD3B08E|nr:hypothetical protein [Staphylococcus epidermidis]MBM6047986.1 hypothetical protein [Staphylococcus epidermidis]